jgi:DNA (cytosine-5)-methyltransferase 1
MTQWALDLFAGPGGWDVYDHELGVITLRVENDDAARATATAAGFVNTHDDVMTYRQDRFFHGLKASPPCQTFSMAGGGKGRKDLDLVLANLHRVADGQAIDYGHFSDVRTGLVLEPLRIIRDALYAEAPFRWIVMEQVPAVLPVWDEYAKLLTQAGYSVVTGNLHAEQYGVPQTRKRAVLIASLDKTVSLPTPTHSKFHSHSPERLDDGVREWVSMAETLGWGMTARPSMTVTGGGSDTGGAEPFGNAARKGMRRELDAGRWQWLRSNHGHRDRPRDETTGKQIVRDGGRDWYYRTSLNHPSPTISTQIGNAHWDSAEPFDDKSFISSAESRRVTVREAAILQTFPADYPWQGTKTQQYQQVGNAIPPILARAILRQVIH